MLFDPGSRKGRGSTVPFKTPGVPRSSLPAEKSRYVTDVIRLFPPGVLVLR